MKNYKGISGLFKKASYKYSKNKIENKNSIKLYWWNGRANLGDVVNKFIAESLSGNEVSWVPHNYSEEHYLAIGSVLQSSNDNAVVWGSGIVSDLKTPLFKPKKVFAVRGPLTREVLMQRGIPCPEVYGDPALLLPLLIQLKSTEKKYKLGIIPHYVNKNNSFFEREFSDDVLVIDIETDNIQKFVDQINSCELIVSSSLHGIIISDAYGIPAHHISFDEELMGGTFKFFDYYKSVGRECKKPIFVTESTDETEFYQLPYKYNYKFNMKPLIMSCPFIDCEIKFNLLHKL